MLRFPKAVTHFTPGSYLSRPLQRTSVGNVFMAGDWVRGLQHGANGLSQASHFPKHRRRRTDCVLADPAWPRYAGSLCQQLTHGIASGIPCRVCQGHVFR